jgi:hypothetical protein
MQCGVGGIRAFDDLLRLGDFCSRAMGDQQELICRERRLVLHNAVLRNAYAEETGSQSTQRTYLYGTFQMQHLSTNDVSWLYRHRPLWDVVVIFCLCGGVGQSSIIVSIASRPGSNGYMIRPS